MFDDETYAAAKAYTDAHGGSGGGVTKEYVDEGLAEKVDKAAGKGLSTNDYDNAEKSKVAEAAISASATGTSFSLTDAADGNVQNIVIKGRTDSATAASVGDNGLTVQTSGKNLINANDIVLSAIGYVIPHGTPCLLVPNTYTFSFDFSGTSGNTQMLIRDESDTVIFDSGTVAVTNGRNNIAIALATQSATISYYADTTGSFSNIQLELGSTTTAYETYKGTSATITTGLPLCSMSESLTDELDMVSGVVHKKGYSVTFDGSSDEEWTVCSSETTGSGSYSFWIRPFSPVAKTYASSTVPANEISNLTVSTVNAIYYAHEDNTICVNENQVLIRISGISTVADLKTYLASHPVTVVYELATPYDAPLSSAEISALTSLKTYNGTTNISCTDSPTMTVSYLLNTDNGQAAADMQVNIKNAMEALSAMIANEYDSAATYSVGDYVICGGVLYRCTTAVSTAEAFDPTKWAATTIMAEIIA